MRRSRRVGPRTWDQRGFTLVELLVYLVVAGIVMGSVYQLFVGQLRGYGKQRELLDVHETLRGAAALLAWELRQTSAAGGDLYTIGPTSLALRGVQGTGVVCARHPTLPRFGLWAAAGELEATPDDTLHVFAAGGPSMADDTWKLLRIQQFDTPAMMGILACTWAGAMVPDTAVAVTVTAPNDTAGILVGAPVRVFRRIEYGLVQLGGRWWLGRKVGGALAYEKLTGPLRAGDGLALTYYDAAGVVTADPTQVVTVGIVLRAESARTARNMGGGAQVQTDTIATKVALRG